MTMNERIEHAAREYAKHSLAIKFPTTDIKSIESDVIHIFKTAVSWALSHQWISVDEELPPYEEKDKQYSIDVIVRCYDETSMYNDYAYYDFVNETWCSLTRDCSFGPVTHWMEIPNMEHN